MKNLDACIRRLRALPDRSREALEAACQESAQTALEYARALVPVRTGRLKNSLKYREENGKSVLSAGTPYAEAVERGTRRRKARPYLRPAARDSRLLQRAASEIRKAMKQ